MCIRDRVYHAGDLNWWHWEGESEEWNRKMAEDYRAEIDTLAGERIDLAFLPVDGRLGAAAVSYTHLTASELLP